VERLMTVDDVAKYLRLNREVVLRKARKGEIPAVKVGTRTYRFYKEQLDRWLKRKSAVKQEGMVYYPRFREDKSGVKAPASKKGRAPVVQETAIGAKAKKAAAASNREQQLTVLKQAEALRARIEKRVGRPLPDSARDIRALREERARRGS